MEQKSDYGDEDEERRIKRYGQRAREGGQNEILGTGRGKGRGKACGDEKFAIPVFSPLQP